MQQNNKKLTKFLFRLTELEKITFSKQAKEAGLSLTSWCALKLRAAAVDELAKQGHPNPFSEATNND